MGLFGAFTDFLSGSVGNNMNNEPDDVRNTKRNLARTGNFNGDIENDIITRAFDDGIKAFQEQNDLRVDGILKPGGETERRIFEKLENRDSDEAFGCIDEINAEAGTVGFGGNITGTLNPAPKRKKPDRSSIFTPPFQEEKEEADENGFTTVSGSLRVNKDAIARGLGEFLMAQNETSNEFVPKPERRPELDETQEAPPTPKRKPLELNLDATGRMVKEKEPQEPENSEVNIPQYDPDPVFDLFRENLKPREGGKSVGRSLKDDPGGDTNKGMSQDTLNLIREKHSEWNLPESSLDLTDKQITDLFRDQFYEFTQIDKLNEVAGFEKTGSRLVEHVFDANVMTRPVEVGKWLQQSIDETIETDLRVNPEDPKDPYDGILGSKTREVMQKVVDQGKTKEVSRKFWQKRLEYLQDLHNAPANAGWWLRVESFKE